MKKAVLGTLALLVLAATPALAGSAQNPVNVSANVQAKCTIAASTLAFGTYDPLVANAASDLLVNGSISVSCTKGSVASVTLDNGSNSSGAQRRMKDAGTNYLNYQIYTTVGRTVIWDTTNTPASQTSASKNTPLSFTTYGTVPQGQDAAVAVSYNDTVTATVNF